MQHMLKSLKFSLAALVLPAIALRSMIAAHGSAEDVADKWSRGISNAQQDMQAGVARVQQAPGVAAANQKQKWIASLQDSQTQDKWERNVRSVSLGSWQNSMNTIGIRRAVEGATAKKDKMASAMTSLLPFIDTLRSNVRSMPSTTIADREQRMLAWSRGMRQYQRPGGTGR